MSLILYIAIMAGVTYLIRVVPFTVFRKKIQNHFLQSFLILHSLCGAECHDHSGNLLLHGQHGDCGGGNRRCGRAGLLQPAADRGSTCSIGSSAGDRIPGISACSISKKHILCVQSAYGGFFRVCHT